MNRKEFCEIFLGPLATIIVAIVIFVSFIAILSYYGALGFIGICAISIYVVMVKDRYGEIKSKKESEL